MKRLEVLADKTGLSSCESKINNVLEGFQEKIENLDRKLKEAIEQGFHGKFDVYEIELRELQLKLSENEEVREVLFLTASRNISPLESLDQSIESQSEIRARQHIKRARTDPNIPRREESKNQSSTGNTSILGSEHTRNPRNSGSINYGLIPMPIKEEEEDSKQNKITSFPFIMNCVLSVILILLILWNLKLKCELNDLKMTNSNGKEPLPRDLEQLNNLYKLENLKYNEEIEMMKTTIMKLTGYDSSDSVLTLDMTQQKSKEIITNMNMLTYHLEPKSRLRISKVKNGDQSLNKFITNSHPSSLKLFSFNHPSAGSGEGQAIKAKFYIQGLCRLLRRVTQEVYLHSLILNSEELSSVVRASASAQRLVIRSSKISTSSALDFSTEEQSRIQYLSFQDSGSAIWQNMEWATYPERFEPIIVAIKNSSIKDSLETINIHGCGISVNQTTELLFKHELAHIRVVQCCSNPPLDS
ncbi:unnamed protein product [Moneuplotes crassus]|uniref:Uncharacterized protein n=1 Tax=Euplotes crassus TaxID=5936 RepID=A0AAD2DAE8_EUPCR|nr:unnamed protein product [Moneuplotes crassus]